MRVAGTVVNVAGIERLSGGALLDRCVPFAVYPRFRQSGHDLFFIISLRSSWVNDFHALAIFVAAARDTRILVVSRFMLQTVIPLGGPDSDSAYCSFRPSVDVNIVMNSGTSFVVPSDALWHTTSFGKLIE